MRNSTILVALPVFLSDLRFEHQIPPALLPPEAQGWRVIELSLHVPWYIASIRDAEEHCTRDLMFAFEADLVRLIETDRVCLVALHRVFPEAHGRGWRIAPISSVWRVFPQNGLPAWVFSGPNGEIAAWPRTASGITREKELVVALTAH